MDIVKEIENELSRLDHTYAKHWAESFKKYYVSGNLMYNLTIFWKRELSFYGFDTSEAVRHLSADEPAEIWLRNFKEDVIPVVEQKLNGVYACHPHWVSRTQPMSS